MNQLLALVFAGLFCRPPRWAAARATLDPGPLKLASANALVLDAAADRQIYAKAADEVTPIASVTKLMTAMVVLDAQQPLDEVIDIDIGRFRLPEGHELAAAAWAPTLPRREMLRLALMSSENRAASSLARHYPGGTAGVRRRDELQGAVARHDAHALLRSHRAVAENVSTASDLAKLVQAAAEYPLIREFTTTPSHYVEVAAHRSDARLQQLQRAGEEPGVGHPAAEDRLHPRGRQVPGHARQHREQAVRDRAARLARASTRASPTPSASSTGSRPANRSRSRR